MELQKSSSVSTAKLTIINRRDLYKRVPEMAQLSKFAVAIYGHMLGQFILKDHIKSWFSRVTDKQVFLEYTGITEEDLLYYKETSIKYLPAYAIVLCKEIGALLIVIRGTKDPFDALADLESHYKEYVYDNIVGKIHSGIYKSSKNLADSLKPKIREFLFTYSDFLHGPKDYPIIILGHSLGAGCAAILRLLWKSDPEMNYLKIKTYSYAPPAVLSLNLNSVLKGEVFSCVNGDDIVPRLSFGSVKDISDIIIYFRKLNLKKEKKLYEKALGVIHGKNEKLVPPGDILQIYEKNKHLNAEFLNGEFDNERVSASFVNNEFYTSILFTAEILEDHFATRYESNLKSLAGTILERGI